MIAGDVRTDKDEPVAGAALAVLDSKSKQRGMIWSDTHGHFDVREPKAQDYTMEVVLDEFLGPEVFRVKDAPVFVKAMEDGKGETIHIVVVRH